MLEIRIIFYYKDRPMYDPDWDRKHLVLPNVGDEVFLKNTNEDQYEKYWYMVKSVDGLMITSSESILTMIAGIQLTRRQNADGNRSYSPRLF